MNKKNLYVWILYDFANSFVFITFLVYFSQWLVIDGGLGDFRYNAIFAISSILLLLSSPTLTSFTDKHGGNKHFLKRSTLGTILGYGGATLGAYLGRPMIIIALLFLIGQYFYQLSFSFYNSLIQDVADVKHRARASGIGQFANSLGQVMGLVLSLGFSESRLAPLLPALIVFTVLSLPMLIFFTETNIKTAALTTKAYIKGSKEFIKKISIFFGTSVAVPMLVAFFFFNDALITISNNYSIYMERVFMIPDSTKNIIMMIILFMSAIGGLSFGYIGDKIGTKKALKYILISRIILLPGLGLIKSLTWLIVCSAFLGFFMGGIWTVTRAYLSQILEGHEFGYGFSFYTLFERFATFLGPLSWGGAIAIFGTSSTSYRITMVSMTIYIVIGLIIFSFRERKHKRNETKLKV